MNNSNTFSFIDLFAGIGGFRIALSNMGGHCINFSEINNDAIETYCTNFKEDVEKNLGDITKIKELPTHDILTAGVPCQSWSIAGKNLGFDDDRGQLWNDTLYLLNQSKPKAFIFENVKGLADPRNKQALHYILKRIHDAGYFANYYVLNSFDYGVPQNRIRIYIVGFHNKECALKFNLPAPLDKKVRLGDILADINVTPIENKQTLQTDLFGDAYYKKNMSLSNNNNGFNDYFLFNDLRNGHSTIHSWDILNTTERQKEICYFLLKNRRKSLYGKLDGNPLSLNHFKDFDKNITQTELDELVDIDILKKEHYLFSINQVNHEHLSEEESCLLKCTDANELVIDDLKSNKELIAKKIVISKTIASLLEKNIIVCTEVRYDFKNTKISTGLFGVNRIFLPSSNIFPTLVASDSNDYITMKEIKATNENDYKNKFISEIYRKNDYRKITKEEACLIQGFPINFILPQNRSRWMKLLGNSVSVPVVEMLAKAILETGINNEFL